MPSRSERTFWRSAAAFAIVVAQLGCKTRPASDPQTEAIPPPPPVEVLKKPAIDLSRGGAGFPLATTSIPTTADDLARALRGGYAERLVSPDAVDIDVGDGPAAGVFDRVLIDISNSAVRPDFVPKPQPKENQPVATLRAEQLRYTADPLRYQHFNASMRLEALNASLGVMPAGDGTFGLSLVDCATAHANFRLSMAGLRDSLARGVQVKQSVAFMVDNVELELSSDNPRSLEADVLVHARLLLIPANFRITGRIDVDNAFNILFTKLNAAGLDATGKVVAGVVQAKLDKLNNKAAPLLKLPGDKIRLSGLAFTVGEALVIDAGLVGTGGTVER